MVFTRTQGACGGSLSSDLNLHSTAGTSSCSTFRLQSIGSLHLCLNGLFSQLSFVSLSGRQTLTHSVRSTCKNFSVLPLPSKVGRQAAWEVFALPYRTSNTAQGTALCKCIFNGVGGHLSCPFSCGRLSLPLVLCKAQNAKVLFLLVLILEIVYSRISVPAPHWTHFSALALTPTFVMSS